MFYKYVTEERIDNILRDRLIRFSQVKALNDPFESRPLIEPEYLKRLARQFFALEGKSVIGFKDEVFTPDKLGEYLMDKRFNHKYGILSLSKTKNNLLMWAHYANNYRGFVVGFNSEHNFFLEKPPYDAQIVRNVRYTDTRSTIELNVFGIINFWCEKPKDWAYEEEVRIFKILDENDKSYGIDQFEQKIYLYEFPNDLVQKVIIGHNMEPKSREKVIRYCSELNNEIKLYETALSKTKYEIELNEL